MAIVIEFVKDWFAEVEGEPGRLRQVAFPAGTRLSAEICPVESGIDSGAQANLRLTDGTTARHVPLSFITLVGSARAA